MTTELSAIFLGAIQGLTEFLPVSSSGHLVLFQSILGWDNHDFNLFFDVVLHTATLIAVLIVLKKPIKELLLKIANGQLKGLWLLAVGTIPAVIVALVFNDLITSLFSGGIFLSVAFLISALWLVLSQKLDQPTLKGSWADITYQEALFIGSFQALAIIPGISRSGSTYIAGLLTKLKPHQSYTFSFLLAVPAILSAFVFQLTHLPPNLVLKPSVIFLGFISALLFGVLGLKLWDTIITKQKYWVLVIYLVLLAVINLVVIYG